MTPEELAKREIKIKIKVNTGDDGIVVLPISADDNDNYTIDWGDGTTTIANNNGEDIKVASIKENIKVASYVPSGISYEYSEKGVNKTVTITGNVFYISTGYENVTKDKIIEIEQWGETGLEDVDLAHCSNLTQIASPSEKSFVNVTSFYGTFEGCISLQSIPEGFFDNCTSVTEFIRTFHNCTSLQSIPEGLFDNCINVTDFLMTFANCTRLEGNAPNLWTRGTNSTENNYEGNPDGNGCFYECTGLTNYSDIPEFWKNLRNSD